MKYQPKVPSRRSLVTSSNIFSATLLELVSSSNDPSGGLGDLAKILAELSGGSQCVFKCPRGFKPIANANHKPSSNGCGSMGLQIDTTNLPGFTDCCNIHDKCYDTCNSDRNQCDEDFKSCLDNVCLLEGLGKKLSKEELKSCETSSDLFYSGTMALGCMAYKEAQRNACLCDGRTITKKEMQDLEEQEHGGEL